MGCLDVNNNPIEKGFYVETFYKGNDEWRNRIIYLEQTRTSEGSLDFFSIINRANILRLNTNFSGWLKPFNEELGTVVFEEYVRGLGVDLSQPPQTP